MILLSALALACVGPVLAWVCGGLARAAALGLPVGARGLERLGTSILVASGIALGATALGWIAAGSAHAARDRWLGVLLVPLCMPSYLAYAGWGLFLAPMTPLGDAIARLGGRWPLVAGQALAVLGLVLWAWPIAALVLILARRRVEPAILDALRLERLSGVRRQAELARLLRPAIVLAFSSIALLMLGSAVPLHLARFETYTINLWRELDSGGPSGAASAWAHAWPILLIALAAPCLPGRAWALGEPPAARHDARRRFGAPLVVLLLASVGVPGLLLARAAGWNHAVRFWRVQGEAAASSALVAVGVAGAGVLLAALTWLALDRGARRTARAWTRIFTAAAIVPGVLVGSAVGAGWRWAPAIADSGAVVVAAHAARFGFIAILAGAWAHASIPAELQAIRALDGGVSLRGWVRSAWPLSRGVVVGSGCVLACLSMHEIESSVMVQPPGVRSLAREVLQRLHYLREQDVAAAAVWMIGGGAVLATLAGFALGSLRVNEGGRKT